MAITHILSRDIETGRLESNNPQGRFIPLPVKVTGVVRTSGTSSSLTVSWTALPEVLGYKVYVDGTLTQDNVLGTSATLTGLTASTGYAIRVSAYNVKGEGAPSDPVTMTTSAVAQPGDPEGNLSVLKAFPTAEGRNVNVITGGRGGRVVEVINLNDSGAGSFRAAVMETGPRIVVFRVGGTIVLDTMIIPTASQNDLTIAGQTAPGGIQIVANPSTWTGATSWRHPLSFSGTDNVIIQYITVRGTACSGCLSNADAINFGGGARNIILDHVSAYWAYDEVIGQLSGSNIIVQNCILAEPFINHACGALVQGAFDFHHNFFTGCTHRSPIIRLNGRVINNIVYQGSRGSHFGSSGTTGSTIDVIGNRYKLMPGQPEIARHFSVAVQAADASGVYFAANAHSIHIAGNRDVTGTFLGNEADQWLLLVAVQGTPNGAVVSGTTNPIASEGNCLRTWQRSVPQAIAGVPITIYPVADLEASLLPHVGNSRGLDSTGYLVARRDAHDTRIINEWNTNTRPALSTNGILTNEGQVGGYAAANIVGGTAYTDTAGDGISDAWKTRNGLTPATDYSATTLNARAGVAAGWTVRDIFFAGMDLPAGGL